MLEVRGAVKTFGGQPIFKDFSLEIETGAFKVLVGPSGCGKSTLFDALTGVTPLDGGQILLKGRPRPHVRDHAAYMQQKDLLLPWFTLMDNSLLPARTGSAPRNKGPRDMCPKDMGSRNMDRAEQQAAGLFDRLGLKGYETHYPHQVSGGMRQRCALVRTLMFGRELILLDEPLSALDAITRRGLQELLLMLQSEFGKTILMITHDIEEALLLGDEICLLSARPMAIAETFRPAQARPRDFGHPELLEIKAHVLHRLEREAGGGTL